MQNKTRTQEISALGHLVIQNSSGPVTDMSFYTLEIIKHSTIVSSIDQEITYHTKLTTIL